MLQRRRTLVSDAEQLRLGRERQAQRGSLARLAELRGYVGGHRAPHREVALRACDGVRLSAAYLPGPRPDAAAVVLCHGFAAHRRKPSYALLADVLAGFVHVLTLDLRGHGRSAGRSTFGYHERHDVAAGIDWLRDAGHRRVVPVGWSMGGASVLHALATGADADADAAVVVSAPGYHGAPRTPTMRSLQRIMASPPLRWGWQGLAGFRFLPPHRWRPYPDPVALAARVNVPLLVVHGSDDHYFPPQEARDLADAAPRGTLWLEPDGFGHAEDGITPSFAVALAQAITTAVETGVFGARFVAPGTDPSSARALP